jgi:hypothetical protein
MVNSDFLNPIEKLLDSVYSIAAAPYLYDAILYKCKTYTRRIV